MNEARRTVFRRRGSQTGLVAKLFVTTGLLALIGSLVRFTVQNAPSAMYLVLLSVGIVLVGFMIGQRRGKSRWLILYSIAALGLHLVVAQILGSVFEYADGRFYRETARGIVNSRSLSSLLDLGSLSFLWPYVHGILHNSFGVDPEHSFIITNSAAGVVTAVLSVVLLEQRVPGWLLRRLAPFLFVAPPLLLMSTTALKEQMIGLSLVALAAALASDRGWSFKVILGTIGIIVLGVLRTQYAAVVVVGIPIAVTMLSLVHNPAARRLSFGLKTAFAGFVVVMLAVFALNVIPVTRLLAIEELASLTVNMGGDFLAVEQQGAIFTQFVQADEPFHPANIIIALGRGVFSPNPAIAVKWPTVRFIVESLLVHCWWYLMLPLGLVGMVVSVMIPAHPLRNVSIIAGLIVFTSFLTSLTVAPEITRFRLPVLPLLTVMVVYAVSLYILRRAVRVRVHQAYWAWLSVAVPFSIVYLLI